MSQQNRISFIIDNYRKYLRTQLNLTCQTYKKLIFKIKYASYLCNVIFSNLKSIKAIVIRLYSCDVNNITSYVKFLQNEDYIKEISRVRKLPIKILSIFLFFGKLFLSTYHWCAENKLKENILGLTLIKFRGNHVFFVRDIPINIRFYLNNPNRFFNVVNECFNVSGWAFDINSNELVKVRVGVGRDSYLPIRRSHLDQTLAFLGVYRYPLDFFFSIPLNLCLGFHKVYIYIEDPDHSWIPVKSFIILFLPNSFFRIGMCNKKSMIYRKLITLGQNIKKISFLNSSGLKVNGFYNVFFMVIIDLKGNLEGFDKTLRSIKNQIYLNYEIRTINGSNPNLNKLEDINDIGSDFVLFIESGQCLSSDALYVFANAIHNDNKIDLLYADHAHFCNSDNEVSFFYKPVWSPDYLETFNYIGFLACFRARIVRVCFDNSSLYDMVLRFTELTSNIKHVNQVLGYIYEEYLHGRDCDEVAKNDITAIQGRLSRTERKGVVSEHLVYRGCYGIKLDLKYEPLVSIVIPTAGKVIDVGGRLIDLIVNIVNQIRYETSYKNIEIIVVDNGNLTSYQRQFLIQHNCKNITYTDPVFNISKKLNIGASIAIGELLLLINDDIEILSTYWITEMVEQFFKPHVGVVGTKLLYRNGLIQHAGIGIDSGCPYHIGILSWPGESGYYFSACGVRNFTAVTGALMMTRANVYKEVGGYSEELAVSFNDIDYCLKVRKKDFSVLSLPNANAVHFESASRFPFADMNELHFFRKKWFPILLYDTYYRKQNLSNQSY